MEVTNGINSFSYLQLSLKSLQKNREYFLAAVLLVVPKI